MDKRHTLGGDAFRGLAGLMPRRDTRRQLWTLLEGEQKERALLHAAELDGRFLDASTVEALGALISEASNHAYSLFDRLWETRATPHPLNSEFLDANLRQMSIIDRDLCWTEWLRRNSKELIDDAERLAEIWRDETTRAATDQLLAKWLMWLQTSTVRRLRDHATRALYWFGRSDPSALLTLTMESLSINDPYVSERMLAALYGVAMALQHPELNPNLLSNICPNTAGRFTKQYLGPMQCMEPRIFWLGIMRSAQ